MFGGIELVPGGLAGLGAGVGGAGLDFELGTGLFGGV